MSVLVVFFAILIILVGLIIFETFKKKSARSHAHEALDRYAETLHEMLKSPELINRLAKENQTVDFQAMFNMLNSACGFHSNEKIIVPTTPKYHRGMLYATGTLRPMYFVSPEANTYVPADPQPSLNNDQLKFLLSQAPMIDFQQDLVRRSTVAFAYIHPKTFAEIKAPQFYPNPIAPYLEIPGSPTKWVLTSLMPEGRVIFSPNPFPGMEVRLKEFKPRFKKAK